YDDKLETLVQYEQRRGINVRDPKCPPFGYMDAIPLDANVVRPEPNILGDDDASPTPTPDSQPPAEADASVQAQLTPPAPTPVQFSFEDDDEPIGVYPTMVVLSEKFQRLAK